jgi:hypothetical protein
MQFSRVITPIEDIQVWNASSDGFSFVISYENRGGPGLQGNPGFLASWRPLHQNRPAVKVIGSPFARGKASELARGSSPRARGVSTSSSHSALGGM